MGIALLILLGLFMLLVCGAILAMATGLVREPDPAREAASGYGKSWQGPQS
jgi:hypothetical protein